LKIKSLLTLLVLVIFSFFAAGSFSSTESEAFIISKGFVKDNLKSPASAIFCSEDDSVITETRYNRFTVESCVDSENGFGALIRNNYTAELELNEDESQWLLLDLDLQQQ
jgi:hypothetical protein